MRASTERTRRTVVSGWARGAAAVAIVSGLAVGASAGQPEQKEEGAGAKRGAAPVLVLERAGLGDFVVDERDAGLARAIGMIPARVRELPGEVDDLEDLPLPVVNLVLTALSRPARVALTYNAQDQSRGAFGVGVVASLLTSGDEQAAEIQGTVAGLIAAGGAPFQSRPSREYEGMTEMFLPFGQLRYGPREVKGEGGGTRWEVHFGSVGDPDAAFTALPRAEEGVRPVIRGRLDLAPLTPLVMVGQGLAAGGPGADAINSAIESGVVGPDAVKYSFQFGYTDDASVTVFTIEGVKRYAAKWGLGTEPLAEADLLAVPADATVAGVATFEPAALIETLERAREQVPELGEFLEEFAQHTGVDLAKDVFGSLGGTFGAYLSESTGGARLGSLVAFATVKDSGKLREANTKLTAMFNTVLAQHHNVNGYVRAREWRHDGATFHTLSFPGIPVPLEVTYAITDRHVIGAITPQAAVAAVRQAAGKGDKGLMSNEAFRAGLTPGKQLVGVSFVDTEKTMSDGYQFVSLMGSALANAVRSPKDPTREPGLVVPPISELRRGVRARVGGTYWEGEDLVYVTRGNRSLVVEACGVMGAAAPVLPAVGAMLGGVGAAVEAQREREMHRAQWR